MKIVCSITVPEAQNLSEGRDVPGLVYVETLDRGRQQRPVRDENRVIARDPFGRFYRFDYDASAEPFGGGDEVILHPVEQCEHVTFTYRDLP